MFFLSAILDRLDHIIRILIEIRDDAAIGIVTANHTGRYLMATLDDLTSAVEANGEVESSAVALIQGLVDRLDDIDPGDAEALAALTAELRSQTDALAAAVVAGTPADPGTEEPPVDVPPTDNGETPTEPGDGTGFPGAGEPA